MLNNSKPSEGRMNEQSTGIDAITIIAKNIKLLVLDVDGVLTTGALWLTTSGEATETFHTRDGFGIKALLHHGVEVAIISGRKSAIVNKRMRELGVKQEHIYQGVDDKLPVLTALAAKLGVDYAQIAYVGDDLPDLPLIDIVGLGIAVNDAVNEVLYKAKWQTKAKGGRGAVREVCDLLLACQKNQKSL